MTVKKRRGKYCKCDWCGQLPPWNQKHSYTHTNIYRDPPTLYFCTKACLEAWVFQDSHRKIISFSNMNAHNYLNTQLIYKKNVRTKY